MRRSAIDILLEYLCGELRFDGNKDYAETLHKAIESENFLGEQLKGKSKLLEALKKLIAAEGQLCIAETDIYFKEGFSMGVLLGLEIAGYDK